MKKRAIELMSEVSKIQEEALEVLRITKYDFNTAEVIKEVKIPVETIKKVEVPVEIVKEVQVSSSEDKETIKYLTNKIKILEAALEDKKNNIVMLEQQIEVLKANNVGSKETDKKMHGLNNKINYLEMLLKEKDNKIAELQKEEDKKIKKTYDIVNKKVDENLSIITKYDNAIIVKYKGEIFEAALDIKATALYAPYNKDSEKFIAELEEQLIKHNFISADRKNKDPHKILNETGYCYKVDKDKYMGYVFNKAGNVMNFVWDTKANDVPAYCMLNNRINNKNNYKAASKKQVTFIENVKSLVELHQQKVDEDKASPKTSSSNGTGMEGLTGMNCQDLFSDLM